MSLKKIISLLAGFFIPFVFASDENVLTYLNFNSIDINTEKVEHLTEEEFLLFISLREKYQLTNNDETKIEIFQSLEKLGVLNANDGQPCRRCGYHSLNDSINNEL